MSYLILYHLVSRRKKIGKVGNLSECLVPCKSLYLYTFFFKCLVSFPFIYIPYTPQLPISFYTIVFKCANDFVFSRAIEIERGVVKIQLRYGIRSLSYLYCRRRRRRINQQQTRLLRDRFYCMRYIFWNITVPARRWYYRKNIKRFYHFASIS